MKERSIQWLKREKLPEYLHNLKNQTDAACGTKLKSLSPADHIICILELLPGTLQDADGVYHLALAFNKYARLLTNQDLQLFKPQRVAGMAELVKSVTVLDATNEMQPNRWRLFSTLFRLGAALDISLYLARKQLADQYTRYYKFEHAPTWRRTTGDTHVVY